MATTSENATRAPAGRRRNLNLGSPERAGAVLAALCEHLEELHERDAGRSEIEVVQDLIFEARAIARDQGYPYAHHEGGRP